MTYEPLYHKYRPQTFAELVGQEAIATTLSNAIRQQRIAHAYLFTGPRGTGKTSSARILAKSLNCIQGETPTDRPCGVCEVCRSIVQGNALDVIEIDAASNTGVDNIRELIERAQFAPVQCRYKVYVIDETHMLSTQAFNALLKTLEEPPPRVVFVLATTDPQRVLPTIISRCQRFDFRRINLEAMVKHLGAIASKEQIDVTPEALQLVAQLAQGGLRDAESLLDQLSLLPAPVAVEAVWDLVGAVPERNLLALVTAIIQGQPEVILDLARQLMDRGREPLVVLQNLASFYRDLLIAKTAPERQDLVALTEHTWQQLRELAQCIDINTLLASQQHLRTAELQIKNTTQPRLWLEVTLMGLLTGVSPQSPSLIQSMEPQQPKTLTVDPTAATLIPQPASPQAATPPSPGLTYADAADSIVSSDLSSEASPVAPEPSDPPTHCPVERALEPSIAVSESPKPSTSEILATRLAETWNTVILQIQPYSTQVLVRQQCRLLALKGTQARVGVTTQQLLKMAQVKLQNIEAAFEKVFGHKVKVNLEVMTAPEISELKLAGPISSPSAGRAPSAQLAELPSSDASVHPAIAPPTDTELPVPSTPNLPLADTAPVPTTQPNTGEMTTTLSEWGEASLPSSVWQAEDEVTKAAKSLAAFFRGKVVDPEGEFELATAESDETLQTSWDEPLPEHEETPF